MSKKTATNNDNDNAHDGEEWRAICERNKQLEKMIEVYELRIQSIKSDMEKWQEGVTRQYKHLQTSARELEDKLYKKNATIYHLSEQLIDASNFCDDKTDGYGWHKEQCEYPDLVTEPLSPRPAIASLMEVYRGEN